MIDVESAVYAKVSATLRAKFPNIFVPGEYVAAPAKFPAVSFVQMDNPIYTRSLTSENRENATSPLFEVNIYSNKSTGKKTEAKAIAATIADEMDAMGFTRTFDQPIPNMDNATIYRIVQRYTGVVDDTYRIYRR